MEIYATKNNSSFFTRRIHKEEGHSNTIVRDSFQRDRDRIIHSRAFRRMMHKTQVFNANKGDHFRNRLTHTLEVSQIARSIGKYLKLNDELIEAIALGHDLGHTPFGHIGERTLNTILAEGLDNEVVSINQNFKHNLQSLRVVDSLETRCSDYFGINLTLATREGILKHTKVKNENGYYKYSDLDLKDLYLDLPFSITLEGQVVAIADEIAQCTHDLEDGVRSGIINFEELVKQPLVCQCMKYYNIETNKDVTSTGYETRSLIIKNLVGYLIYDVCIESEKVISDYFKEHSIQRDEVIKKQCILFSDSIKGLVGQMKGWMNNKIIFSAEVSIADAKAQYLIKQLFKAFYVHPKQLPDYVLEKYFKLKGVSFSRVDMNDNELKKDDMFIRMVADHIGGMTDQFASRTYKNLYYPDYI